jgi:hypothetical protein
MDVMFKSFKYKLSFIEPLVFATFKKSHVSKDITNRSPIFNALSLFVSKLNYSKPDTWKPIGEVK